ncbi:MAG TPA: iron-sulfur cluster assembly accessory protein [Dehalococcoidia bacterium]|nr:iron-sulfur cluster assembly accessory protein [Dehalococcoidia bacterium]
MPREAPGEPVRDEDPSDGALVTLTEAAAERVRELIAGAADVQLRVAIEKKGRPRHVVSLSDESEEGDVVFEDSGITIAVAAIQTSMLRGATIDFVSDGTAGRFEVTNPNLAQLSMDRLMRERAEQRAARGAGVDDSGEERKR